MEKKKRLVTLTVQMDARLSREGNASFVVMQALELYYRNREVVKQLVSLAGRLEKKLEDGIATDIFSTHQYTPASVVAKPAIVQATGKRFATHDELVAVSGGGKEEMVEGVLYVGTKFYPKTTIYLAGGKILEYRTNKELG